MKQFFSRPFWPLYLLLAALFAAICVMGMLIHQWQQQQTSLQLQLLTNSASLLSIQPLQQNKPAELVITLRALQQHSALPIRTMAVFDQAQQVFASTSTAEPWLEQAAQSFDAEYNHLNDSGVELISTPIWADRSGVELNTLEDAALATAVTEREQSKSRTLPPPAVSSKQLGYLLIQLDPSHVSLLPVLLPMIVMFCLAALLVWRTSLNISKSQRLQIEAYARQLATDDTAAVAIDRLQPIASVWLEKKQQVNQQLDLLKEQFQSEMNHLIAREQSQQQTNTQLVVKQQQLLTQQQVLLQQLNSWQHFAESGKHQSLVSLQWQLNLLALYTRIQHADFMLQPDAILIPDWLLQLHREQFQPPHDDVQFIFEEDPQAYSFKLNVDPGLLANFIGILLKKCQQLLTEPEIIFSYSFVEAEGKQLHFNIKYVGQGFPTKWRQVLAGERSHNHDEELDAALCRCILQKLQGQLQIDSVDDLGTQLRISLPVSWQKNNVTKTFQSILLVDEKQCRLPLAKQSLMALGEQVHSCNAYLQLQETLQRRLVDLLVLMLPADPSQLEVSIVELKALSQRVQMQIFAPDQSVQHWQSLLDVEVFSMPLLIAKLASPQPPVLAQQQLLVVDDNPTNLSYVRAVLAMEGLRIDIAMTGEEAIKMASNNRYQLILMDIQLPDMPGTEVTKQIRQLRHHQQTIIMAFTAHALPDEIASFRLAGMDDVLIKPLDTRKISHILGRIKALDQIG
jgi:CheY-like chemotaxis protein